MPPGIRKTGTRPGLKVALYTTISLAAGCGGPQSALDPAGVAAEQIAALFWWMFAAAVLIWLVVIGIAVYATAIEPRSHAHRTGQLLIIIGGAVFPSVVLAILLVFTLPMLPVLKASPEPGLQVEVSGEQWWWRVRYLTGAGEAVELANEVRLPVGTPVEFILTSPDVIHSFWIPALGGKMDMIPGRVTRLTLEPTRTGTYNGVCAEYCGSAHALMKFMVRVMEPAAFREWLAAQAAPAAGPRDAAAAAGREAFMANGCGSCHTIRGTAADGALGPDLTHVGSRMTLGAGILANEAGEFLAWLRGPGHIKPGVRMPAFDMLPERDLEALAAYLESLQ